MKSPANQLRQPTPELSCLQFGNHWPGMGSVQTMKVLVSGFIFAACQLCFAAEDTNIIAISEWSKPVSLQNDQLHDEAIRGRLLILQGMEPAGGGPDVTNGAMTFIELQNVTGVNGGGIEIYFAVTNLHCELSDGAGKIIPPPTSGAWGGRGPFSPYWVNLPYNSKIRLFVNGGSLNPLMAYPSGEPWTRWSIPHDGTNVYYLTGTLSVYGHTNSSLPSDFINATLSFPKMRLRGGVVESAR